MGGIIGITSGRYYQNCKKNLVAADTKTNDTNMYTC